MMMAMKQMSIMIKMRLFEADVPAQVVVLQQPRGSYTLEVFKGFLAVGGGQRLHF
jgi:hypothetical protein